MEIRGRLFLLLEIHPVCPLLLVPGEEEQGQTEIDEPTVPKHNYWDLLTAFIPCFKYLYVIISVMEAICLCLMSSSKDVFQFPVTYILTTMILYYTLHNKLLFYVFRLCITSLSMYRGVNDETFSTTCDNNESKNN